MTLEKEPMGINTIRLEAYEGDIASRLRNWRGLHISHSGKLFEEAAAEIERLRSQPCPHVTGTVTRYCTLTPFTLTEEELRAIRRAKAVAGEMHDSRMEAALGGLLERLG